MALSNHDQTSIRDYLLGKLNDEQQQEMEERLMVEDELFQEFEVSKGELVEEYVTGDLPAKEHEWFRTHFLASPEGRQSEAFALAMARLQDPPAVPTPAPAPAPDSWWERFRSFFTFRNWTIRLATTAAALAGVALLISQFVGGRTVVGPTLVGTTITRSARSEGSSPIIVKVPKGSNLKLRLLLPQNQNPAPRYRAELDDRLNVEPVNVVATDAEGVWVEIPAKLIPPGEYSLQLVAIKTDGSEERIRRLYQFNVVR